MKVILTINKNSDEGIHEALRVIKENSFYLVQSFSETRNKWISQKEYRNRKPAMADCISWY